MADGPRELALPAAHHARDHGLGEIGIQLIKATGLTIQHRGLAARIVGQREGELRRCVVDVDILAARDHGGGAPATHAQVLRDGGREATGVREDGNRAGLERIAWRVSSERTADAHAVPGVGHAQAIGAEDVDPCLLAHGADLARVMHRDLLGDDEDLLEVRVHADQLGHAVARCGGRQIHHPAIEAVSRLQTLAHVVVDRDVTGRRRQHLTSLAGRRAEDDVAARVGVAHRSDVTGFATQDVEHANAVFARGNLREGAGADVVLELADALLVHGLRSFHAG